MRYFVYALLAIYAMTLLSSCEHDEPVNPIKPLEDRTVLLVTPSGEIYNQNGDLVQQLSLGRLVLNVITFSSLFCVK